MFDLGDLVFVVYDSRLTKESMNQCSTNASALASVRSLLTVSDVKDTEESSGSVIAVLQVGELYPDPKYDHVSKSDRDAYIDAVRAEALGTRDHNLSSRQRAVIKEVFGDLSRNTIMIKPSRVVLIPTLDGVLRTSMKDSWFLTKEKPKEMSRCISLCDEAAEELSRYFRHRATVGSVPVLQYEEHSSDPSPYLGSYNQQGQREVTALLFRFFLICSAKLAYFFC